MSLKLRAAIASCKATHNIMRKLGRNGRSLPGMLALKIDSSLIKELSAGHKTIMITGTNGKTTTTHMIQQAIINTYGSAAYDPSSTNMAQGIATTLCLDSSAAGERKSDWAIIESDEGATKTLMPATKPQVLVVTNLFRDQVDRYPTWTTARDYIIEAIKTSPETTLVLDADCQVCASIADVVPNTCVWYGVECAPYDEGVADFDEQVACIKCGAELEFSRRSFAHLGDFSCPNCGYTHHKPDIAVIGIKDKQETSCTLTLRAYEKTLDVPVNVRAGYDIYNAAAAFSGLLSAGLPEQEILSALANFTHAAHRFEIFNINGAQTRLLLMKNTAGCNQLINMIVSEDELPKNLVCLLGNEIMDGISTEWIQEVRWEKLITDKTRVIVGGPCYQDMKKRLLRAGVTEERLSVETSYPALIQKLKGMGEPVTVIANCSTIEDLRVELVKTYQPSDYWGD